MQSIICFGAFIKHSQALVNLLFSFLVLASSLVFNLADGQFSSRADLVDAPGSSLGRGAQVAGLGKNQTF